MTAFTLLVSLCFLWMLSVTAADSNCKLDLGLVVDTTKSVDKIDTPLLKKSLRRLVKQFKVSENGTHVSLETFINGESTMRIYFKDSANYNEEAVLNGIDSSIDKLKKPAPLYKAIQMADEEMFTVKNGHRHGVQSAMVFFTDEISNPKKTDVEKFEKHLKKLKSKGVHVVVDAIGPDAKKKQDLFEGAEVFTTNDYKELGEVINGITTTICPPNPCQNSIKGMDVAFLVDRTGSIGKKNFELVRGFLLELADALTIGPQATHTGFIVFARKAKVLNTFSDSKYHSGEKVHDLIENISNKLGKRTFIDRALKAANDILFTEAGGDRPDFPNVLVLLTDEKTNKASVPFSQIIPSLKAKRVRIVAIGVGKHKQFQGELEEIAGDNVYTVDTFDKLSDLFTKILNETCSADGGFSPWGVWSDHCINGVRTRTRICTKPPPQGFGKDCDGDLEEEKPCNVVSYPDKRLADVGLRSHTKHIIAV